MPKTLGSKPRKKKTLKSKNLTLWRLTTDEQTPAALRKYNLFKVGTGTQAEGLLLSNKLRKRVYTYPANANASRFTFYIHDNNPR